MKEVNREQMVQWLEMAEAMQEGAVLVGSRIEALELAIDGRVVESQDRKLLSELPKALVAGLKDIKNMQSPEDKECKELQKLFERIIEGQIKGLKALSARKEEMKEEEQILYGIHDEEEINYIKARVAEQLIFTPSEDTVAAFWKDMLRESRKTLTLLQIKYQCYPEWMKGQPEGETRRKA